MKHRYSIEEYLDSKDGYSYELVTKGTDLQALIDNASINRIDINGSITKRYKLDGNNPFNEKAKNRINQHIKITNRSLTVLEDSWLTDYEYRLWRQRQRRKDVLV